MIMATSLQLNSSNFVLVLIWIFMSRQMLDRQLLVQRGRYEQQTHDNRRGQPNHFQIQKGLTGTIELLLFHFLFHS